MNKISVLRKLMMNKLIGIAFKGPKKKMKM